MRNKSAARVMLVEGYKTVLLFTSGLGIAVQAPYLKQLILGNISQEVQRIHVIWQFEDLGKVSHSASLAVKLTSQTPGLRVSHC